jgi:hypothetical protein
MELPHREGRAELVRRYAHLLDRFANEIGQRPLVLQNASFFPDLYERDEPSAARLLRRLQAHAGLSDVPIRARVVPLEMVEASKGSCGSGACGPVNVGEAPAAARIEEHEGGWLVNVFDAELQHPVGLTTQLARALGRVFLAEASTRPSDIEAPEMVSTELAAVALGLGPLLLEGSYVYGKSCGGPSVTQLTKLSVGELAVACSLFIEMGGHSVRRALGHLSTTQRALLSEASEWAASNSAVIQKLSDSPGQLAISAPDLRETKPWLLRLFDRPRRAEPSLERALSGGLGDKELLELARAADPRRSGGSTNGTAQPNVRAQRRTAKPDDDLRALVDEALRSS